MKVIDVVVVGDLGMTVKVKADSVDVVMITMQDLKENITNYVYYLGSSKM